MSTVMKLVKYIGQPVCILLYIGGIVLAVKKKFIPLISLIAMHISEFFIIGKKTGEENDMSLGKAFIKCFLFGFTWWLPVRKSNK